MFTGIIETKARIITLKESASGASLSMENPWTENSPAGLPKPGESISVNGACLTVVSANERSISFDISAETLKKTTFSTARAGLFANVERSLRAGQDISGHFVTGHVDGVGRVERMEMAGRFAELSVRIPRELLVYVVPKGSIAIDGVSLTVAGLEGEVITVALIPETLSRTTLADISPGDSVNIETDILGKYVVRYLEGMEETGSGGLTLEKLSDAGF